MPQQLLLRCFLSTKLPAVLPPCHTHLDSIPLPTQRRLPRPQVRQLLLHLPPYLAAAPIPVQVCLQVGPLPLDVCQLRLDLYTQGIQVVQLSAARCQLGLEGLPRSGGALQLLLLVCQLVLLAVQVEAGTWWEGCAQA